MKRILKRVCIFGIVLLCCLAFTHATLHRFQKPIPKKVYIAPKIERKKPAKKNEKLYAHLKPKPIDHEALFFRTIIDNNLFAPLGWKPKKPTPIYRLIGTHISVGRKIEATAILQETSGEATIRIVSIGTKLGEDTVVADIQPKQVILKKGKLRIPLRLATMQFLTRTRTRR